MILKTKFPIVIIAIASIYTANSETKNKQTLEVAPVPIKDQSHRYQPSSIQKIHPFKKSASGSTGVSAVEIGLGLSTDVSPTTKLYFTFNRWSEMRNTHASYYLGLFGYIKNYKREKPGIYSFEGLHFSEKDQSTKQVKVTVDTTKLWAEDKKLGDFEDGQLKSKLKVTITPSKN